MASPPSGIAEAIDIISEDLRQCRIAAPIDVISEDLLQNIVSRLPAVSFASAACVSRSWNVVCDRVLSRPKLASACSFNHTLQDAVEEVVNKVLSEPIRPHFAIASFGGYHEESCLGEAHQLVCYFYFKIDIYNFIIIMNKFRAVSKPRGSRATRDRLG
ncbi:putative F-box domain-containing protein [Helianthus annuus]|nr:putative F-box domain-containing protein [Helianthus annuus]